MRTPDEPDTHTSPRRARVRPGTAFPRRSPQATWRRRISRAADRLRTRGDDALPPPATSWEQFDERLRSWPPVSPERREWLATQRAIEPFVAEGLRRTRDSGDWSGFELYVLAVFGHPSRAYTDTLCAVLDDERHEAVNSEDVVDALFDVADPAAVPSLRRAVTWVPDWDEFGQLARKAVWALDRIGTPEAVAAIREEVADDAPFNVVEAAREAFERIEDEDAAFARLRRGAPGRPAAARLPRPRRAGRGAGAASRSRGYYGACTSSWPTAAGGPATASTAWAAGIATTRATTR